MKISITPISVSKMFRDGKLNVEGFINYCAELGADGVDILHSQSYPWLWKDKGREFKSLSGWIEKAGLKLAAYATGNNFAKLKEAEFLAQVELVKSALCEAAELGAPALRVFGGHHEDNGGDKGVLTHNGLALVMRGVELCLPFAAKNKVVMALENHGRLPGHSYELAAIIRHFDSPYVQCTFDCSNFMGGNMDEPEDPLRAYDNLRLHIAHVHVKDNGPAFPVSRNKRQGYVAGCGDVPLRQFVALLERDKYDGYCSLEYEAAAMVPEEYGVPQSIECLKHIRAVHQTIAITAKFG